MAYIADGALWPPPADDQRRTAPAREGARYIAENYPEVFEDLAGVPPDEGTR